MAENDTAPQDSPPAGAAGRPTQEERTWAMVAHISGVASGVVFPMVVPIVIYMVKKDESEFIGEQAKEAINFQITVGLAAIVAWVSLFCFVGFILLPLIGLASLVFAIVAGIKVYDGERYRYPYTLRLI